MLQKLKYIGQYSCTLFSTSCDGVSIWRNEITCALCLQSLVSACTAEESVRLAWKKCKHSSSDHWPAAVGHISKRP